MLLQRLDTLDRKGEDKLDAEQRGIGLPKQESRS